MSGPNFDPATIERNRTGSPYVELADDNRDAALIFLGKSVLDYDRFNEAKAGWTPPEALPPKEFYKVELVKRLIKEGTLNFWDVGIDLAAEAGTINEGFDEACASLVRNLSLEVKVKD